MKQSKRLRSLTFERLETKATPSSLLLALAPLDESIHVSIEQIRECATAGWPGMDTSGNWQFEFLTGDVLRFVERNTRHQDRDSASIACPTAEQCERIDETMKLGDGDVRALIIADNISLTSITQDH
jgi:hypothetical protein